MPPLKVTHTHFLPENWSLMAKKRISPEPVYPPLIRTLFREGAGDEGTMAIPRPLTTRAGASGWLQAVGELLGKALGSLPKYTPRYLPRRKMLFHG